MNSTKCNAAFCFAMLVICMLPRFCHAQVSLKDGDTEQYVIPGNDKDTISVLRDAFQSNHYYWVPNKPRLVTHNRNGADEPEFTLLQYVDPSAPDQNFGGVMQFSVTLDIGADTLQNLASQIASKHSANVKDISLSALPIKSGKVYVYQMPQGTLVSDVSRTICTFASQKLIMQVPLTHQGAAIYNALSTHSMTGVAVYVDLSYQGVIPAGFTITANYHRLADFYSKNTKFAAQASYFGLFGASVHTDTQELVNTLKQSGGVDISVTPGEGMALADLDKYLSPLLEQVNARVMSALTPPATLPTANAAEPSTEGRFGGVGYSVQVKDAKTFQDVEEVTRLQVWTPVSRMTGCDGFINLESYLSMIDRLVIKVPINQVGFLLPQDFFSSDAGVSSADLTLNANVNGQAGGQVVVQWTLDKGWQKNGNEPVSNIIYPLSVLNGSDTLAIDSSLIIVQKHQSGSQAFTIQKTAPFHPGDFMAFDQYLSTNCIEKIGFDPSSLTWHRFDPTSHLEKVDITVKCGDIEMSDPVQPRFVGSTYVPPTPLVFLLPKTLHDKALQAKVVFHLDDGTVKEWPYSATDLHTTTEQRLSPLSDISLSDSYWKTVH